MYKYNTCLTKPSKMKRPSFYKTIKHKCLTMSDLRKIKKTISRGVVYYLTLFGVYIASHIPRELGQTIGGVLGAAAYYLLRAERNKTLAHLEIAFGKEKDITDRKRIARACFSNLGKNFFDMLIIAHMPLECRDKFFKVEGAEYVEESLRRGKGTIIVTAHLSAWELFAYEITRVGLPLEVVAKNINNDGVNHLLVEFREKLGIKTHLRNNPHVTRNILRSLKSNRGIGILIDQDTKVDGVFVEFFNRPANTPRGAAMIAMATGATVLPGFIVREGKNYVVRFEKPVEVRKTYDKAAESFRITQELTKRIEKWIRSYPEQWVWMHRRWRRKKENT